MLIALSLGTVIGAGALGVMGGLKAKEEILRERHQATEDSIAAIAMANSEAAIADSGGATPPDSSSADAVTRDTSVAPPRPLPDSAPAVLPEPVPAPGEVAPPTGATEVVDTVQARRAREASEAMAKETAARLSKIFSQMKPGEAADVLSHLSDGEIERILLGIRERDAAAILAQLDPERAAAVSRRVLGSGSGLP